jgi:hypothetical protein
MYRYLGWKPCDLYAKPFHREMCDPNMDGGFLWAIRFWRPDEPDQKELL